MIYSPAHNVCVYEIGQPEPLLAAIPKAKLIKPGLVAIPCQLDTMQAARKLGLEALSPIMKEYHWPIKAPFKPYDHQRHTAAFMTLHPRSFNLNDIGTGKTLATLWAADYLMSIGAIGRALILSPLSTLYRVWQNEIFTHFLGARSGVVLHGDRDKRLKRLSEDADFYILNHDGLGVGSSRTSRGLVLGGLAAILKARKDIDCVIVDEGTAYKDGATRRYRILRQALGEKPYIWWLTGTPTPGLPTEAWSQARMVRQDYTESLASFRERTMYKITNFKYKPRDEAPKITANVLQPAIRYRRDECIDLPPLVVENRDVALTPVQEKAYKELKQKASVALASGSISAVNEAALRLKLIQVCLGALYDENHDIHRVDCAPRLNEMKDVIEQVPTDEKILIFAPLTSVVNLIYDELKDAYTMEKINGQVSTPKRSEVFRAFQQEANPRIIVADPRTMAHGLTLTAATTIIWYGPTDMPEVYTQANGRINRPGQTKSMLVVRLAATTLEREIFKRLDNCQTMQGVILQLVKEGNE